MRKQDIEYLEKYEEPLKISIASMLKSLTEDIYYYYERYDEDHDIYYEAIEKVEGGDRAINEVGLSIVDYVHGENYFFRFDEYGEEWSIYKEALME